MSKLAYTLTEAAEATGLSEDTLKRAIRAGTLRAKKSGKDKDGEPTGKFLIRTAELEGYLEGLVDA